MIKPRDWKSWLVIVLATITIFSALFQIVAPESALGLIGFTPSAEAIYLFRLSSLLTGLFGGMLLHTMLAGRDETGVILWAAVQKIAGVALVVLGVLSGTVASAALLVAGYDFAAGVFLIWYLDRLRRR